MNHINDRDLDKKWCVGNTVVYVTSNEKVGKSR